MVSTACYSTGSAVHPSIHCNKPNRLIGVSTAGRTRRQRGARRGKILKHASEAVMNARQARQQRLEKPRRTRASLRVAPSRSLPRKGACQDRFALPASVAAFTSLRRPVLTS